MPSGVAGSAVVKLYIFSILLVPKLPRVIHFTRVNVNPFNSVGLMLHKFNVKFLILL